MNIEIFFEKIVKQLDLGIIKGKPSRIYGGLTHKMYALQTNTGRYIIKLLNPNIMKRPTALNNFKTADEIEEILKDNYIEAIYSLIFRNKKMQSIDGQYFYVYNWYNGKSLSSSEISKYHCEEIGKVLSKIHNIDLKEKVFNRSETNIDFKKYINLAKEKNSPIYEMLYDKVDILNDSMTKGNIAVKNIPSYNAICHNDLDSKNVLWINDKYKIIDLECLGYSNPYLELFSLALCWSGYEECNINFELFQAFIKTYFENSKLNTDISWENIYYSNYGRLEWLEFNIKRSLMIDCDTKEEQELGINEVKETIAHVVYYDKVKEEILNNISF